MQRNKILTGVVALGVGIVVTLFIFGGNEPKTAFTPFVVDPSIVEAGSVSGITEDQLREIKAQYGAGPCKEAALGCYVPATRTLYVERGGNVSLASNVAYEYMHDVWSHQLSPTDKNNLKPLLTQLSRVPSFQPNLQLLGSLEELNEDNFQSEMLSSACVYFRDDRLPQALLDTCNHYLPGRGNLQRYF